MTDARPKRIAVLGSTGSIGTQTLEVVRGRPDCLAVVGLGGGRNVELLARQVSEFKPRLVHTLCPAALGPVAAQLATMEEIAAAPAVDLVVVATGGIAGLSACLAALRAGKQVALANKESLVVAGKLVMAAAAAYGGTILPVDSEHSALWQCLQGEGEGARAVRRVILTASGGAFRDYSVQQLARVTPEETLRHPTWRMGPKVTVDSATLMNKGLEVIEARWLFGLPFERIDVVLHRESVIHSLVEFVDGSLKAQMGVPDMRLPIQYALSYPERWANPALPTLDLAQIGRLTFAGADPQRFPCLHLALEAGRKGGTYPAVLAGADEAAVDLFLAGRIGFLAIASLVERALAAHAGLAENEGEPALAALLDAHQWAQQQVYAWTAQTDYSSVK